MISDSYDGQAAVAVTVVTAITIETLITAILTAAACIVVAGVIYYAGKSVAKEIERTKQQNNYFKAYVEKKNVFINISNSISRASAISRIHSGSDVYTYKRSAAKSLTKATGLGCTSPEISCFKGKKVRFYHYHTANRNEAHIFYGLPVIE